MRSAFLPAIVVAVLSLCVLPLHAQSDPAATEPRRVVLLYDERTDLPGLSILDASLVQSLTTPPDGPVEFYREALDLSRFPYATHLPLVRDYLRTKYAAKQIDVVVAAMGPSLDFLLQAGDEVFPGVPIVFCGIDRRELAGRRLPERMTGVLVKREFAPTLDIALRLQPDTTSVVLISGTSEFDTRLVEQARNEFRRYEDRLVFTYLTTMSLPELLAEVAHLPPQTIVLYTTVFRDGAGTARIPHEVIERIAAVTKVPVYGFIDQFMGRGIVGGQLYSLEGHGHQAGELARQVLAGRLPSELPLTEGGASVNLFDWRQLQRWNLSDSQLPAGSTVLFRPTDVVGMPTWQIVGAGLLVLLQTALIATLLFHRARNRQTQTALTEEQQRYVLASTAGAVGVWDWNFETNELFIDASLKAILGYDDAEISSRPDDWGSKVYPDDVPLSAAGIQTCLDGKSDTYEVEHRMLHKDGSVKWMLSRGSAIRAKDGSVQRLVGTKVDITARKAAEDLIREGQLVLEASHLEIQELAGRLIASQELERARIARDLHDDFSQQIAGLAIALSGLRRRIGEIPEAGELPAEVAALQKRAIGLADIIRRLSHSLHPRVLEHAGLVAALRGYCAELADQHKIPVTFAAEGDFGSRPNDTALCLYRVAQESLRNAITHANAVHVDVRLQRIDDHAELVIADDGRGFDVVEAAKRPHGLGLVSIVERVRLARGTVSIVTEVNKGTRVRVRLPMTESADSSQG